MRKLWLIPVVAIAAFALASLSQKTLAQSGPYKVVKTVKGAENGGMDYIYADTAGRRLYIPRRGPNRVTVYDLDTLAKIGEIPNTSAAGAAVSTKSGHGFATSRP